MKKILLALAAVIAISACTSAPAPAPVIQKESFPYGMSEKEWNELSIKDKARMRRDFYFYEKGNTNFVDPQLEIEGRQEGLKK